jgi:hypothetical protein
VVYWNDQSQVKRNDYSSDAEVSYTLIASSSQIYAEPILWHHCGPYADTIEGSAEGFRFRGLRAFLVFRRKPPPEQDKSEVCDPGLPWHLSEKTRAKILVRLDMTMRPEGGMPLYYNVCEWRDRHTKEER